MRSPGTSVAVSAGSRLIWICRAMRSSSSSRSFSACSRNSPSMPPAMWLNESASSPSWSRLVTGMRVVKSPCRSCSVPRYSECTLRVIERASISPRVRATAYRMRKMNPTAPTAMSRISATFCCFVTPRSTMPGERRRSRSKASKRNGRGRVCRSPVAQSRRSGRATPCKPLPGANCMRTPFPPSSSTESRVGRSSGASFGISLRPST